MEKGILPFAPLDFRRKPEPVACTPVLSRHCRALLNGQGPVRAVRLLRVLISEGLTQADSKS